jgi:hypothetical protein
MRPYSALAVLLSLWAFSCPAYAQSISVRDSILIHATAVAATLDAFRIDPNSRIWIERLVFRSDTQSHRENVDSLVYALRPRYPGVSAPPSDTELFLCPAGVSVRMPGRGCPIIEDGVVVRIQHPRFTEGSVHIPITVIRSKGAMTWAVGHIVVLVRQNDAWRVVDFIGEFIT